jgi:hypothetical protein
VRVGITVPQFRTDAEAALEVARRAEAVGLDGVFVFDHLWPLGRPDRPALHSLPLVGALVAVTRRLVVGTLVARVGLLPDAVLVNALVSAARMAGRERFVAGLGTGDRHNRAENVAYGVPFPPKAERLARLAGCLRDLRAAGVAAWAGGLSAEVRAVADETADAWNGWGVDATVFAALAGELVRAAPTWGGQVLVGTDPADVARRLAAVGGDRPGLVRGTVEDLGAHLRSLAGAGAAWAVCAPLDVGTAPDAVDLVAAAASTAR